MLVATLFIRPSIQNIIRQAIKTNLELIKDIGSKALRDLEREFIKGVSRGASSREMAKIIRSTLETTKKRAALIARDQIGSINSSITQAIHKELGIDRYIWRTMKDDRVRPAHRVREGKAFSYSSPPPDGNPGEPINCRCMAEPIF